MSGEYRNIMRRVFKNDGLSTSVRVSLAEITLHSRLFSGAGVWDKLGAAAESTLRAAYMAPLRASAGMVANKCAAVKYSNDQVLVHLQKPPAESKVRLLRFAYVLRFARYATPQLIRLNMLQHNDSKSWINTIMNDLWWMWQSFRFHTSPRRTLGLT